MRISDLNLHPMDQSLQTILHLYGEADGPVPAEDAEAPALAEARFWMDHRPRVRPDAATLDVLFSAAAQAQTTAPGLRRDRAPVARRRTRRASVLVGLTLSLAAAVVVLPGALSEAPPPAAPVVVVEPNPEPVAPPMVVAVEAEALTPVEAPVQAAKPSVALAWEGDRAHLDAVARKTAELRARLDSTLWDAPGADLTLKGTGQPGTFTQAAHGGQ